MSTYRVYGDDEVVKALLMVKDGKHPSEVSKELGFGDNVVAAWARYIGLKYQKIHRSRDWAKIKELVMKTDHSQQ